MKLPLLKLSIERQRFFTTILAACFLNFFVQNVSAQGTWTALTHIAPNPNLGGMLVLSDGTILCKTSSGTTDGIGNLYNRLTPDASGSYANGTWSSIAAMHNTRLYYSSQVLKDGRVYVAGGEYGTGGSSGEHRRSAHGDLDEHLHPGEHPRPRNVPPQSRSYRRRYRHSGRHVVRQRGLRDPDEHRSVTCAAA